MPRLLAPVGRLLCGSSPGSRIDLPLEFLGGGGVTLRETTEVVRIDAVSASWPRVVIAATATVVPVRRRAVDSPV